ncbi:hypothetical protein D3C81_1259760 [compost metagenome]
MILQLIQRFGTVGGDDDLAAQFAEHAFGHQLIDRVVLNQQHPPAPHRGRRFELRIVNGDHVRLQGASQVLVQSISRQWSGLLLQRRECGGFFAGQETAVGGYQQNRRPKRRAQAEQTLRTIGDHHVRRQAQQ